MTENHPYHTPEKGTLDWNVPLNDNFRQLDRDVEVRDVETNLDDYTPKTGALFRATDTGAVFVGDGSNWQSLNPPSRNVSGDRDTVSGDGVTTVFTLSHSLGTVPSAVMVTPASVDASTDFMTRPGNHTASTVEIEYFAAPAAGDGNLAFEIITVE